MHRSLLALVASLALAAPVAASTLTMTPDKAVYDVGETITLSFLGVPEEGFETFVVSGFVLFDTQLVSWQSTEQELITSFGGQVEWTEGGNVAICNPPAREKGCLAFDQVNSNGFAPLDGPVRSTMKLTAVAPGVVDFRWDTGSVTGVSLIFFELTDAPGATITIVPEPTTATLLALGLLGISLVRRTR